MGARTQVEEIFNEISMKASEEAGSHSSRKPVIYACEVEKVVAMI
jgi:hypothetical protein